MEEIKSNCSNCWFSGIGYIKEKKSTCKNKDNPKRFINPDSTYSGDKYIVNTLNEEFDIECDLFIPMADSEDIELEPETTFTLSAKCPTCGHDNIEYDQNGEGQKIIECEECEKQFGAYWCIY